MKSKSNIFNMRSLLLLCLIFTMLNACDKDDEQSFEKTRLFRPVLNEDLYAEGNTIFVNMANLKQAIGYVIEVSRDTFATIDYTIQSDTNYVEINENTVGEELFWNTLYQVRATALESDSEYNSRISDLGNVRTEVFPSILNSPAPWDVTDVAARVTWDTVNSGAPITGIKVFSADDLKLNTPLFEETPISSEEDEAGEGFVYGLTPETDYQIAIFSGAEIRGWVNYTTKVADIDPNSPGVIDIRDDESPSAVTNAVAAAQDGDIILIKRGITYDLPTNSNPLTKSITIRGAYGFGEQKAKLFTTGNWGIAQGSNIGHIRFIDVEIKGEDYGGDYVFNPNTGDTNIEELLFDNCKISTLRGIFRLRGTNATLSNYEIRNSTIDSIGNYGIITCDTNPGTPQTATVENIKFVNSTFNHVQVGITSRNNSASIVIESCTFANFPLGGNAGYKMFRYRGGDDNNNVANGIIISNTIYGHAWDQSGEAEEYPVTGIEGLPNTSFDVSNTYTVDDFSWYINDNTGEALNAVPNLPLGNAGSTQDELWVDPENNNFNIKDSGFPGKSSAGDPRWRVTL
ncbi:DUF5123 domain-containing protein [Flavobacteriaceae bacterium GSB9]|nr:DUF5123 domain-containing protein [Flavobacteriaceae bacterium GSB9]